MSIKTGARHSLKDQAHLDQALSHLMNAGATLPEGGSKKALDFGELMERIRTAVYASARAADTDGDMNAGLDTAVDIATYAIAECDGLIHDNDGDGDIDISLAHLWPRWFYDGYVITQYGPCLYQVNYTTDATGIVTADPPTAWTMVEMAFAPIAAPAPVDAAKHTDDFLITQSNEIKSLGDGKFGGYLVRFGDAAKTDLEGDYFTKDTDFDFTDGARTTVYYDHGLDPVLKRRKVGEGSLKRDEVGVWLEFQLQRRDEYEQAVEQMAKKGKLGLSSGTAPHLVERVREGKANRITAWPLGIDASVTPTPAEPRTMVLPLKSYLAVARPPLDDIASQADGSKGNATGTQVQSAKQRERALMLELELLNL